MNNLGNYKFIGRRAQDLQKIVWPRSPAWRSFKVTPRQNQGLLFVLIPQVSVPYLTEHLVLLSLQGSFWLPAQLSSFHWLTMAFPKIFPCPLSVQTQSSAQPVPLSQPHQCSRPESTSTEVQWPLTPKRVPLCRVACLSQLLCFHQQTATGVMQWGNRAQGTFSLTRTSYSAAKRQPPSMKIANSSICKVKTGIREMVSRATSLLPRLSPKAVKPMRFLGQSSGTERQHCFSQQDRSVLLQYSHVPFSAGSLPGAQSLHVYLNRDQRTWK